MPADLGPASPYGYNTLLTAAALAFENGAVNTLLNGPSFPDPDWLLASLPGPTRQRSLSPYWYQLVYRNLRTTEPGCALLWKVFGGREVYQIVLERDEAGTLHWHCTCADAVYRGEDAPHRCKHVQGLQAIGRRLAALPPPEARAG
jgi:hypothetical protein